MDVRCVLLIFCFLTKKRTLVLELCFTFFFDILYEEISLHVSQQTILTELPGSGIL